MLHYIGKEIFPTKTSRASKKYPFSIIEISTVQKVLEKFNFHSSGLQTIFATSNSIKILQNFDHLNNFDSNADQVVIIDSCIQFNNEEGPTNLLQIDRIFFDLRLIFSTWVMASGNFDCFLYCCHEVDHFSGWWCQNGYDN